jgi:hypothetical protein
VYWDLDEDSSVLEEREESNSRVRASSLSCSV